jgi:general secretion pathway protein G
VVLRFFRTRCERGQSGYSLLELIITLGVLAVLVMGTIPMAENSVRRQKELRLRESLRMMRAAIDEFKRDTLGACGPGASTGAPGPQNPNTAVPADPRSRVFIDDCKIFDTDNLDKFPPSLDILVSGVKVRARGLNIRGGSGLQDGTPQATDININQEITKVYLRELPIDPFTGKRDWKFRSSYQNKDSDNWDEINVFDVRSASKETALNGEKYSDW